MKRFLVLATLWTVGAYAGTLVVQVSNPETNAEAKSLNAVVVADVTACHEPAKSTVTAYLIQPDMQRVALRVMPLKQPGTFAIIGAVPPSSVIDVVGNNPEYRDFHPHVLIRSDEHGVRWTTVKRFFSKPPTDADVRALL
ncbi:MAG TPA: hypothetical protein DEQ47_11680 [Solibacterales bacterium]|nr:hypothetical protein [Bryobacterales bacterium]